MKKALVLILLALVFACNTAPVSEPVDLAAEEVAIKKVFETMEKSIVERDIELLASIFADDGIFIGTSPNRVYTKDTIVNGWSQSMEMEETPEFEHISDPLVRIQPDGKTAIVSIQYNWKSFTPLPIRQTFWLVKKDGAWIIDFFDMSFIPYDKQIPLLNAAVSDAPE